LLSGTIAFFTGTKEVWPNEKESPVHRFAHRPVHRRYMDAVRRMRQDRTRHIYRCGKGALHPRANAVAELRETDQVYEAVGTVRPKTETRIEARVTGQVLDVRVSPGDPVAKGNLLISLDSRQMTSRLDQAKQALKTAEAGHEQARHALEGAQAGFKQAQANYDRVKRYFESQAATAQDLERAESTFRQAEAGVKRAQEGLAAAKAGILQARAVVNESTISIEYTRILAPEDGVVLKRFVEPGDLALPGKPLMALRTSGPCGWKPMFAKG
jgi:HlyD family secretion protein